MSTNSDYVVWQSPGKKTAALIKEHSLFGLCESDGCLCLGFEVHRISVDVSCRKSGAAKPEGFWGTLLRVHTSSFNVEGKDLELVAEEAVKQLSEQESVPIMVRYASYDHDCKCICIWCHKSRAKYEDYLCEDCKKKPEVQHTNYAQLKDFSRGERS